MWAVESIVAVRDSDATVQAGCRWGFHDCSGEEVVVKWVGFDETSTVCKTHVSPFIYEQKQEEIDRLKDPDYSSDAESLSEEVWQALII